MQLRNRDEECYRVFDVHIRKKLGALVNEELIREHAANPMGPHSDALSRVLNFLRRGPVPGKLAVFAEQPFGPYRILRLTGQRGRRPDFLDERRFASLAEIYHQIFLIRLAESLDQAIPAREQN